MRAINKFFVLAFLTVAVIGCQDGPEPPQILSYEEQLAIDVEIIDQYLADNNINAQIDPSGLRYVINEQGSGVSPNLQNNVEVAYDGRLLSDGSPFDQAPEDDPLVFPLNRLIEGWQIGLRKIQSGGNITLYIPSGLGYGTRGQGSIPSNANLIFDITLIGVE